MVGTSWNLADHISEPRVVLEAPFTYQFGQLPLRPTTLVFRRHNVIRRKGIIVPCGVAGLPGWGSMLKGGRGRSKRLGLVPLRIHASCAPL